MKPPSIPQLIAITEGANIALDKPIVLLGRHQECDVQIPSRKISRRHCCLAQVNDHLVVRDLGSTNGIRINGIKVVEGNLQPQDELTIGNVRYRLQWGACEATARESGAEPRPAPEALAPVEAVVGNSLNVSDGVALIPLKPQQKV